MIGYTTVGTNDFDKAAAFYDALFGSRGIKRTMEAENYLVWGKDMESPAFSIVHPHDGKEATVGNGVMIALEMENEDAVKTFYNKAIELGASCEGEPGPRGDSFYAAYFRDLDGNKLNGFCVIGK